MSYSPWLVSANRQRLRFDVHPVFVESGGELTVSEPLVGEQILQELLGLFFIKPAPPGQHRYTSNVICDASGARSGVQ
jgi:hypothetical protein